MPLVLYIHVFSKAELTLLSRGLCHKQRLRLSQLHSIPNCIVPALRKTMNSVFKDVMLLYVST